MADNGVSESFSRTWTWMAVLAVICIVGGFLALLNPFGATIFAVTLAKLGVPDPGRHPDPPRLSRP